MVRQYRTLIIVVAIKLVGEDEGQNLTTRAKLNNQESVMKTTNYCFLAARTIFSSSKLGRFGTASEGTAINRNCRTVFNLYARSWG